MDPSISGMRAAFARLREPVLERWVGIDEISAEGYYKAEHFVGIITDYLTKYAAQREAYKAKNSRVQMGELHEQIDQVYARLIGHSTKFSTDRAPLKSFRIREHWQSRSPAVKYWCAAAGFVMYGREKKHNAAEGENASQTARPRWMSWAKSLEGGQSRPAARFVMNVATRTDYWHAFRRSWSASGQHLPQYRANSTGKQKDFSESFRATDPTQLHSLALQEGNRWMQMNVYDNHQYIERGVLHMPPWVKIGFKPEIIAALNKWVPGDNDWETRINWTEWPYPSRQ